MKRVVCLVCLFALLFVTTAYGDPSKQDVCDAIATQMGESFDSSSSFAVESYYDSTLDSIFLKLTAKDQDHAFYEEKRASNDIQPLYDMLARLNVYFVAQANFQKYSISGVDMYFVLYSNDGILEYLEVNGRNISSLLS